MPTSFTRRDFLKLSASLAFTGALGRLPGVSSALKAGASAKPNVIIVLFDALSAFNLSLYGYRRRTSPNLERFAERAVVFHNHHSAGNFTTPSTASLFTSTYPWTHRAYNLSSLISPQVAPHNLFAMLDGTRYQAAFAQNTFADMLLYQFQRHLDRHEAVDRFALAGRTFYDNLFQRDAIYGMKSMDQFLFKREEAHGSLFLSIVNDLATQAGYRAQSARLKASYPSGPPRLANTDVYFDLPRVMDGVMGLLDELPQPFFTYFHFMPPHMPYVPRREFIGMFDDGWNPPEIKRHRLAPGVTQERLNKLRTTYDEFVADLDDQFGRLIDHLDQRGLLEDSYVIFTSDHGELFERGVSGHSTPVMFEPLIRIPLVVHTPGQRERVDVRSLTSNVDVLPTLLKIAGVAVPSWAEGRALPGLGGEEDPSRNIYVVEAKANPAFSKLRKATLVLMRGPHKLVRYLGYKHYSNNYEYYNLETDPSEQQNLYPDHTMAKELQAELDEKLEQVDRPYL
ncbi:MAG: sulfatase-like hydrolase/transferase [Anaerolineales bacterium]|nr:sulfatase-like hydrolase/transferase [Anaerolineales bacterium]